MDRKFAEEIVIDTVYDLFPSTDLELTPGISDAIDNLIDEIEAAIDAIPSPIDLSTNDGD